MYDFLANYYDLMHVSLVEDINFVLALAKERGDPVLELGCGTGRIVFPLAQHGFDVIGVDNSSAMLAIARRRLAGESEDVRNRIALREGDIRKLTAVLDKGRYPLILLSYNTLFHFQTVDAKQVLKQAQQHLSADGRLFIDVANPYIIAEAESDKEPILEETISDPASGGRLQLLSRSDVNSLDQKMQTTWFFRDSASSHERPSSSQVKVDYWYYYPHQLEVMLQECGLQIEKFCGGYDGSAFDELSERLLIVAHKLN